MKIMLLNTLYSPYQVGGAEKSVQILAESLVKRGHEVRVLSIYEGERRKIDYINGVEVVYLPLKNIYWPSNKNKINFLKKIIWHIIDNYNFLMGGIVLEELKEFGADIMHTNNLAGFSVSVWNKAREINIPILHTTRDYYLFHPNCTLFKNGKDMYEKGFSVKLWSWMKKRTSRNVSAFVGISDFMKNIHRDNNFFHNRESYTIYNPVSSNSINNSHSIGDKVTVGFIGRLSEEKGFDTFCQFAERKNYRFIAAGEFSAGQSGDLLKEMARKAGVELLGFCSLSVFMKEVDVVMLPIKWREPFGRVVVESALNGKIVLTLPNGGVNELINLLPNVYEIGDYIDVEYLCNNKSDIGNVGDLFLPENIAAMYEAIYYKIKHN
ncbi:Uncharacterized 42.6 kDa protein in cps region [Serratia proteamaculans]|uniref:glycosyltransferase family 4 protein n=1 Tax=Serratia proteamaculans TaxID=28151 RepID=UPI0009F7A480|nr:glycosyltransferase family 4 protein [Serratia proteamaculans]SMB29426.1 Uncharacterized 42.6 kDa protein in cps region [Serratia proteamaculans]